MAATSDVGAVALKGSKLTVLSSSTFKLGLEYVKPRDSIFEPSICV